VALSENLAHDAADAISRAARLPRERRKAGSDGDRNPAPGGFAADAGAALLVTMLEAFAITVSSVVAGISYSWLALDYAGDAKQFFANGMFVAALFCGAMRARDAHRGGRVLAEAEALRDLLTVWFTVFCFVGFVWFFLKLDPAPSRGAFLGFFGLGLVAVAAARRQAPRLVAAWYHPRRFAGDNIVLVGAGDRVALDRLATEFRHTGCRTPFTVNIAAHAAPAEWALTLSGALREIRDRTREAGHGQICVAADGFPPARLAELMRALQSIPHAIRLVPEASAEPYLHLPTRNLGRLRAVEIQRAPLSPAQRALKRLIDLCIAIPCLFVAAPTLLLIALAVRLDSKGPIFFRQHRLGYRGRPFTIFKFRTMDVWEDGDDIAQAKKGDARITRLGRMLRAASLDELPQLFNVIRGDMSLVGPRPHAIAHDHLFASLIGNYELRQHVMPGVTGWAQVHGLRGETATTELMRRRVEFDLWYAKNASILLDLAILARTVVEVFRQRNAH
jgi:Undecaprenyl-phosphate glucose phosphotransferase